VSPRGNKAFKIATAVLVVAVLLLALWIMARGLGLAPDYDFGAGAYYYADIPDFEKHVGEGAYQSGLPLWAAILLFLAWGALMYLLWIWLDKRK
jgi:hypothetical protein